MTQIAHTFHQQNTQNWSTAPYGGQFTAYPSQTLFTRTNFGRPSFGHSGGYNEQIQEPMRDYYQSQIPIFPQNLFRPQNNFMSQQ